MIWDTVATWLSAALLLGGSLLTLLASIGLLRLPDLLARMHVVAKPQVLGVLMALLGLALTIDHGADIAVLVAIGIFQLITVPVGSHMVGRAAYRTGQVDPSVLEVDELGVALAEEERASRRD